MSKSRKEAEGEKEKIPCRWPESEKAGSANASTTTISSSIVHPNHGFIRSQWGHWQVSTAGVKHLRAKFSAASISWGKNCVLILLRARYLHRAHLEIHGLGGGTHRWAGLDVLWGLGVNEVLLWERLSTFETRRTITAFSIQRNVNKPAHDKEENLSPSFKLLKLFPSGVYIDECSGRFWEQGSKISRVYYQTQISDKLTDCRIRHDHENICTRCEQVHKGGKLGVSDFHRLEL